MKLKAAIVGLGRMGAEPTSRLNGMLPNGWDPISHAEAIKSIKDLELVALCDKDDARNKRFSELYSVKSTYTDYKDLINEAKPDILSIATRTDVKAEIINYALEHGVKGFYVEKPLSRSVKECREVLSKIEKASAKLVYGTQRRGMHIFRKVQELCASQVYGDVKHISFEYGRNQLLWSAPHITDMIVLYANSIDVEYISALCSFNEGSYDSNSLFVDTDPWVENAYIKFTNGVTCNIIPNEGNNLRIQLSKAIIAINGDGYSIDINTEHKIKGRFHKLEQQYGEVVKSGTQMLFEDLTNAVLNSTSIKYVKAEEILCGTKLLSGIVESALKGGKKVNFKDVRDDLVITGRFGNLYA